MRIPVKVEFGDSEQTLYVEAVNVPNESGQSYITGSTAQTTGNFTVLLYDYTNQQKGVEPKELDKAIVPYGNNIEFEMECPKNADTTHQLQLLFYTGEVGKTAYINSTFTNLKIEDITDEENPPVKIFPMSNGDSGLTVMANDNTAVGAIDYQWRRIAVLDYSYGIYPGHKYRITMSKASYEVVDDKVTTYMKFKITDCQGGLQFSTYDTIGSLTATFTIKVKLESGEIKTFKTDTVEDIPVYEYKLSADHIYKFADASILKNLDLNVKEENTVNENNTFKEIIGIEAKLYDNLSGIFIEANLTYIEGSDYSDTLDVNSYAEMYDGIVKINSNFDFSTYNPTLMNISDKKWHYIFKYSKGYIDYYYIVKLTSTSLSDAITKITKKSFNFTHSSVGFSIISNPKIYNKTVISNSLFNLNSKYLRVDDYALGGYNIHATDGSDDFITIFTYCGVIGRVNDSAITGWSKDPSGLKEFEYKRVSEISTIDFIPTQLGDGTTNFFSSFPKGIAINGVSSTYKVTLANNSFSNLPNTTNYYIGTNVSGSTNFGNGNRKTTFDGLYEGYSSSGSGSTTDYISVTPSTPGITPKSYEMNMYKPFYNNPNIQNLIAREDEPNKYLTISQRVTPGDRFLIKIDEVSINSNSVNKDIKQFTTIIYRTTNTERPSWYGEDVARIDMDLGEDLCYSIECPSDVSDEYPIWLLIYDGIRGKCNNNSIDFKNITVSNLYTIADYYSYDKIQIGKDSYGRGE